jgi:osmotically inducible lipoprotein OsmB
LTGCTLGGAAVGGVAGNKLTHGSTLGTVGGAVAGGVVGYELSK